MKLVELLGCVLAPFLVLGWLFIIIVCVALLFQGINLEAMLDSPIKLGLHQFLLEQEELQLKIALPSKVISGSSMEAWLWVSPSTPLSTTVAYTTTEPITVSTHVQLPLVVTGTNTISLTILTGELFYDSLGKFNYECMNLETEDSSTTIEYTVVTSGTAEPQAIEITSLLDTDIVRRRLTVNRTWELIGIALGAIVPIVIGAAFRSG